MEVSVFGRISITIATRLGRNGRLRAAINLGKPVLAQRSADGQLGGVSVALARELARQANCELDIMTYDAAGKVVDACRSGAWDVAFLAIDSKRATEIAFTEPYVKIDRFCAESRWALNEPSHRRPACMPLELRKAKKRSALAAPRQARRV